MSIRVMADVWDFGPEDPVDNSVLIALASHANDDGLSCFPSVARVAKMLRRSERTVERSILAMEQAGWLTVERGGGRGFVSKYAINTDKLKGRQADAFLLEKGRQPRQKRATATTEKGDSHDNPPHPLLGRNVIETSINHEDWRVSSLKEELFPHYLNCTGKSSSLYTLTPARLEKGKARLQECVEKAHDREAAVEVFKLAINALCASAWHMGRDKQTNGKKYNDWTDHLCRSAEQFEKWLDAAN